MGEFKFKIERAETANDWLSLILSLVIVGWSLAWLFLFPVIGLLWIVGWLK